MTASDNTYQPPCEKCGAKCCHYVAIEIERPTTKKSCDYIRWYLNHRDVNVFVDHDRKWYVEFRSPCDALSEDLRCSIYPDRPKICRDHGSEDGDCEYFDSPYILYFTSSDEFERYMDNKGVDWKYRR